MRVFRRQIAAWLLAIALLCFAGCTDQPVSSTPQPDGASSVTVSSEGAVTASFAASTEAPVTSAEAPVSGESALPPTSQPQASQSTQVQSSQASRPNGSQGTQSKPTQSTASAATQSQATTPPPTSQPSEPGGIPNKVTVTAPGTLVKSAGNAVIDYSNNQDGYVMVRFTAQATKRLKVQLKGPKTTYTYNLTPEQWTAFPFSDENGSYQITVLQNTTGNKYAKLLTLSLTVTMKNEFAPFLHSNQYVDFDAAPNAVAKAAALTSGITDPLKKVEKIYDFVVKTLTYDRQLAATVQTGYLPKLDQVLAKKTGICFDYAALMTGMLRSLNVPTKLVVGYAGEAYHAWISVWSEKDGWVDGVIYFDGTSWKRMDPTYASSAGGSSDIMDYIGDGSNYAPKYFY